MLSRKILFACLFLLLGLLSTAAQSGFAQSINGPLNFEKNFSFTGDYVVAGAYGLTAHAKNGFATGTITIPDPNPGITGTKSVPVGAAIGGAFLYWQAVVASTTPTDPSLDPGANGFFRPVFTGGPQTGYPITGVNLMSQNTVSFSNGGCTGSSTGKVVRTYRTDVRRYLRQDATGLLGTYEVMLASNGNGTPFTLGATLVIFFRVLSPDVPLNSMVIYDGAFAPGNTLLTMTQTVQGFYQAANNPVSRLTHIVGSTHSSKFQTVYLNNIALPSLYGSGQPAFPGWYGPWDNPTWTFPDPNNPAAGVKAGDASATTMVVPSSSQQGCPSWGAVIVSTTVQNSDGDGLLDVWKAPPNSPNRPGYCDAAVNEGVCNPGDPSWVDLPGAKLGQKDVFVQLDYMCSSVTGPDSCTTGNGKDYSFDPRPSGAVDMITSMTGPFYKHGIHVHVNPPGTIQPVHAIPEPTCVDNNPSNFRPLCAFPNQPGVVAWKVGVGFFKNQLVDPTGNVDVCRTSPTPANCMRRSQHGRGLSWHYLVSAHRLGRTKWKLQNGTLTTVAQSGNMVTFTTSTPHGTLNSIGTDARGNPIPDPTCQNGRVTVANAISNPNLNGTYCVQNSTDTTFTINIGGNPTIASYDFSTDPNLGVAPGKTGTASGNSDIGGGDSAMTLGLWGDPSSPTSDGQSKAVLAGTFTHELGHAIGLTHGGYDHPRLTQTNKDYTPVIGANCAPNFQSVMNYLFQVDLLGNGALDYSEESLADLDKSNPTPAPFPNSFYSTTSWYVPKVPGTPGTPATQHCNGTPLLSTDKPMNRVTLPTSLLSWSAGQDINFDGNTSEVLHGHNDWIGTPMSPGIDLRQLGATGNDIASGGFLPSGGGLLGDGGGLLGDGGGLLGDGGGLLGDGGGLLGDGGGLLGDGGGANEISSETANSVTRPPRSLTAAEAPSPRTITLNWTAPTFGQIGAYNVYRSENGGAFTLINAANTNPPHTVTGNPPVTTFTDRVACDPGAYRYFVTAVLAGTNQESVPSNIVSTGQNGEPLTGCYLPPVFLSPAAGSSPLQGSVVTVKWTVKDASNQNGVTFANNPGSNTLVAVGPISNDVVCNTSATGPRSTISSAGAGITFAANTFTFNWNTSLGFVGGGAFPPGCYLLEVDLDSGQPFVGQASAFQRQIYLSDVNESVLITTTSPLPDGTVGVLYNQQLQETGGVAPLNWAVVSGSLPPGTPPAPSISLNSGTGVLSGYATTAGTYNFTAQVTDSIGDFGTKPLTLTVHIFVSTSQPPANPPFTPTTTLPNGVVWSPYTNTVYESGGVTTGPNNFSWTIVPNSVMPGGGSTLPGLSFQPNAVGVTNGTLSGTPTASGIYNFTVKVTDSVGNFGTQALTLIVDAALLVAHSVTDGSCAISQLDATNGSLLRQFGTLPGTPASPCTEFRAHLALSGGFLFRSNGVNLNTISEFGSDGMLVRPIIPNTSATPSIVPIADDFANQSIYMVDTFGGTTNIRHLDNPSTGASSPFVTIPFYTGIAGISDLYFGGPSGSQALFALTQTDPSITPCFNTSFNPCPYRVAKIDSSGVVQFFDNPNLIVPFVFDVGSLAVDPTSGTATSGNIYVATGNISATQPGKIVKLSAAGAALGSFNLNDGKPSLDVDLSGNIFVGRASSNTGEISVFSAAGGLLRTILVPNATSIIDVLIAR